MRDQDLIAPLAEEDGTPTLYATLGATLHLEPIMPDDAPALAKAVAMLYEWLAPSLRFTRLSCWDEPIAHRAEHVEYITEYPANLVFDRTAEDAEQLIASLELQTRPWSDYEVMFHGGAEPEAASPFQLHLWAEIPRLGADVPVAVLPALSVRVPCSTDPAELRERVLAVASLLRLRWGNVGYTYSYYGEDYLSCWDGMYAHARRFTGFDVPEFIRNMDVFSILLRSVNWVTILGDELAARIEPASSERARAQGLTVHGFGSAGALLQAGSAPERGDRNRLGIPRLYVAADELVRPFRASDAEGDEIVFMGPWDYDTVSAWLRRFEVRLWSS
jgi:hypothetical protein